MNPRTLQAVKIIRRVTLGVCRNPLGAFLAGMVLAFFVWNVWGVIVRFDAGLAFGLVLGWLVRDLFAALRSDLRREVNAGGEEQPIEPLPYRIEVGGVTVMSSDGRLEDWSFVAFRLGARAQLGLRVTLPEWAWLKAGGVPSTGDEVIYHRDGERLTFTVNAVVPHLGVDPTVHHDVTVFAVGSGSTCDWAALAGGDESDE